MSLMSQQLFFKFHFESPSRPSCRENALRHLLLVSSSPPLPSCSLHRAPLLPTNPLHAAFAPFSLHCSLHPLLALPLSLSIPPWEPSPPLPPFLPPSPSQYFIFSATPPKNPSLCASLPLSSFSFPHRKEFSICPQSCAQTFKKSSSVHAATARTLAFVFVFFTLCLIWNRSWSGGGRYYKNQLSNPR